jgi:hypothetical protein
MYTYYTYDENLELIQPLVQEYYSTLFFFQDGPVVAIFDVRSGRNLVER